MKYQLNVTTLVLAAAAAGIVYLLARKAGAAVVAGVKSATDAAASVGEGASASVFDALHPSLSADAFNAPTLVDPSFNVNSGEWECPDGYTLRKTGLHGWYCARTQ